MELIIAGLLLGAATCWLLTGSKSKKKNYEFTFLVAVIVLVVYVVIIFLQPAEHINLAEYNNTGQPGRLSDGNVSLIAVSLAVIGAGLAWLRQRKETTSAQINGQSQTDVSESEAGATTEAGGEDTDSGSSAAETVLRKTSDEASTGVPVPETPKRSAVDEIKDLSKRIHRLQAQVGEIDNFARASNSKLALQGDEQKLHNIRPTLAALMRVYNQLFRRVQAMEAGGVQPDPFILDMLPNVETELQGCGVSVIRPHPGDSIDLKVMNLIGFKATPFWKRGNRVAQMEKCGYMLSLESGEYVLEKAEVVVYRDTADVANSRGDTNESSTSRN